MERVIHRRDLVARLWRALAPFGWEIVYYHEEHKWALEDWTQVPHRPILSITQISLWRLLRGK